jgi:alanine dehydrogenase
MLDDPYLAEGLNIHDGQVTHIAVAQALGLRHTSVRDVLVPGVAV